MDEKIWVISIVMGLVGGMFGALLVHLLTARLHSASRSSRRQLRWTSFDDLRPPLHESQPWLTQQCLSVDDYKRWQSQGNVWDSQGIEERVRQRFKHILYGDDHQAIEKVLLEIETQFQRPGLFSPISCGFIRVKPCES